MRQKSVLNNMQNPYEQKLSQNYIRLKDSIQSSTSTEKINNKWSLQKAKSFSQSKLIDINKSKTM